MSLLFSENKFSEMPGMLIGKVISNYDKEHLGMVQVSVGTFKEGFDKIDWMKVLSPCAGNENGFFFFPSVGDEVLVGFIGNDVDNPCVIGSLWNEVSKFPKETLTEKNTVKKIITKSGTEIHFDEESGKESIRIPTPKKLSIKISDEKKTISISDDGGNNGITIDADGGNITIMAKTKISFESDDIELISKNGINLNGYEIKISAKNAVSLEGKAKLALEGAQIETNAKGTLTLKSSGITEVKGSMVKING